jgi:hypothetical protein
MGLTGLGTALGANTSPHETSVVVKGNTMETSEDAMVTREENEKDEVLEIAMMSGRSSESEADADTEPRCTIFTPTQKPAPTPHLIPPKRPSNATSSGRPSLELDSVYRTFVKKWCFVDTNSRTDPGFEAHGAETWDWDGSL